MNKKILNKLALTLLTSTVVTFNYSNNVLAKQKNQRIYGKNRIETSIEISKAGWKNGSNVVVIAQGYNYADALCASPLAKKYNAPIILTGSEKLDNKVLKELKRLKVNKVFIVGGEGVISEDIEKQLKNVSINDVKRLYGKNRYETSVEIAKELDNVKDVFITSGNGYADSLSIASIAAQMNSPILFADKKELKNSVKEYINTKKIDNIYVIGGKGVIEDGALGKIKAFERISGKNRFETNKNVLIKFKDKLKFNNVYVVKGAGVNGNEFADALSCSGLAAQMKAPIVLTYNGIDSSLKSFIKENLNESSKIIAIGGETIVNSNTIQEIMGLNDVQKEQKKDEVKPSISSGGGGSSKPIKPSNSDEKNKSFTVKCNNNKISISLKDTIATQVALTLYDINNTLAYIGQAELNNGEALFNTKLIDGKYFGYYKFLGKEKTKVDFEVKNGNISNEDKIIDKKVVSYEVLGDSNDFNIKIINTENKDAEVSITLYDENNNLAYIGQERLKNGEIIFKTQLQAGKYSGFYRLDGEEKVNIESFKVK